MPSSKRDPSLNQLSKFVSNVSGLKGVKVVKAIGEGATDEKIEKSTKLKVSEVRSILNQLHNYGIVEYTREKNMSNGWFTYTWKLNMERAMQNYHNMKRREYEQLRELMNSGEGAMVYKCKKGCASVQFDDALECKFRCPDCNGMLKNASNREEIKKIEQKIGVIEKILGNQLSSPL